MQHPEFRWHTPPVSELSAGFGLSRARMLAYGPCAMCTSACIGSFLMPGVRSGPARVLPYRQLVAAGT